jgi:hypothetical protein
VTREQHGEVFALVERVAAPILSRVEGSSAIAALLQGRLELALEEVWPDRWVVEYIAQPHPRDPCRMFVAGQIISRERYERRLQQLVGPPGREALPA